MEKTKYDVFISYRREGGDKYARTIQQALEKQYRVFLDFDELKDGVFDQRIIDAISESPVFLLILSKGALDRCVNENDWVRQEILHATKCGCHIVPVTIDDTFEGLPASLPEELRHAVGQHQFSELQMKTLFKTSMEQLVRNRIEPYIHREDTESGAEIHIETDADCDMFRFKTFIRHLKTGEDNVVRLNPGKYKFNFVSTLYPEAKTSMIYSLSSEMTCDFIEVDLMDKLKMAQTEKLKCEDEQEEERLKTEMEQKRRDALEKQEFHPIEKNGKYGFVDEVGNVVIPCKWKGISCAKLYTPWSLFGNVICGFSEGLAHVKDDNDKWGFIDKTGEVVIPCKWNTVNCFCEGLACVEDNSRKWGYIDKIGTLVIPCKWNWGHDFSKGLANVMDENKKWWKIDKTT